MTLDNKILLLYILFGFAIAMLIIFIIKFLDQINNTGNDLECNLEDDSDLEHLINIPKINKTVKWNRNKCSYMMNNTLTDVLDENNINKTEDDDWQLYFPCTYDEIEKEIGMIKVSPTCSDIHDNTNDNYDDDYENIDDTHVHDNDKKFFIIHDADEITAKNYIWKHLVSYYGRNEAVNYMPRTYILSDTVDVELFDKEYNKDSIYIMKKNIQRQEGLLITNKMDDIKGGRNNGYVIVQELLQDPFLVNNRKINLRCYILVVCQKGDIACYVHNEGFMYYTKDYFKKNSTETGPNITTGYIDRSVYEENPLTHGDFRKWLDKKNRKLTEPEKKIQTTNNKISKIVFNNINILLKNVMIAMTGHLCQGEKLKNNTTFQLFGADVAPNENLESQLIEINKGPDLSSKDERDGNVKKSVIRDMLSVLNVIQQDDSGEFDNSNETKNGFIKLFETNNNTLINVIGDEES
jgi:hypothetical protein